jgi:hypothetical protein
MRVLGACAKRGVVTVLREMWQVFAVICCGGICGLESLELGIGYPHKYAGTPPINELLL